MFPSPGQRRRRNPAFWPGALDEAEGRAIRWHSPDDERSSQIFSVSAFGGVRSLPDRDAILDALFAEVLPEDSRGQSWTLRFEHADRRLLGEGG